MMLSGWGNYPRVEVRQLSARGPQETMEAVARSDSLIARGNGRAYGDAALNRHTTLSMLPSNRILAFDSATGRLTCEAGLMLADLLSVFVPHGWFPPVTPGTR
ncbi:MAG: FAD-binding protein, partial [Rhodospirillaceae bacterium]